MDLKNLFEKVRPFVDQFNAIDLMFDKTAKLPSGTNVKYLDIIRQIDREDESLVESYNDDRDKEAVTSLITFFRGYEALRVESVRRVVKNLESCGFDDLIMITAADNSKYLSAPNPSDTGIIYIATNRLVDGLFAGCPYTWGFLRCTNDYDEHVAYPFDIRFSLHVYVDESDEGYKMSDETVKQCPKFDPISIIDPELDTKLRDNFKLVHDFIMRDIDAFFKKNAELHEELKKELTAYINAPDTELGALIYLKEVIDDELS